MKFLALCLLGIFVLPSVRLRTTKPASPGPACHEFSLDGRISGGEAYSHELGGGLWLRLTPSLAPPNENWGWVIQVEPQDSNDDYAWPVNPPFHFGNSQWLATGCVSAVLLCFLPWGDAFAQLQGRFSLEKEQYEVGEPVFLRFDLTNVGKESIQIIRGNQYSYCGGYKIEVSSGPPIVHSSCDAGYAVSCGASKQIIAPGETRHEKVLLNYDHDLSKSATYDIHATYATGYGPETEALSFPAGAEQLKVESHFQVQLTNGTGETLSSAFQPFLADLASKDEERQREAARVIGSLAPAFLENTILSMMGSPATRPFALLGLKKLNTARSRDALAAIVQDTTGYSYEKEQAIKYLSEMNDKKYFPLLLDVAEKQPPNEARDYVLAAAQLGGDDAMPFIGSLLENSDPFSRANGVMGLSQTGSRRAVPILIETLKSSDTDLGKLAFVGLTQLTHRSPLSDRRMYSDSPSQQYAAWFRWWSLRGNSAPMYGPHQCGEIEALN